MNSKKSRALRKIAYDQTRTAITPLGVQANREVLQRRSYQEVKRWYKSLSVTERMKIGRHAKKEQQSKTLQAQQLQEHKKG